MNLSTLHPMVVHFPMALAILQPILLLALMVAIAKKLLPLKSWWIAVGFQVILLVTAFIALQTGEIDEEIVENVVRESYIEEHEHAAEFFLIFSGLTLAVMVLQLFVMSKYTWFRAVTLAFRKESKGGFEIGR